MIGGLIGLAVHAALLGLLPLVVRRGVQTGVIGPRSDSPPSSGSCAWLMAQSVLLWVACLSACPVLVRMGVIVER